MDIQDGTSERALSVLETFAARLKESWTYTAKVSCYQRCDLAGMCDCRKEFVDVDAVISWMNRRDSEGLVRSKDAIPNAQRLLIEINHKMKGHQYHPFPVDPNKILSGENCSVLVFSILVEQGCGELIDIFQEARIYDKFLDYPGSGNLVELRKKLTANGISDVEEVIQNFDARKWAYIPRRLTLHMEENFEGGNFIVPFCRYEAINDKGGTASVYRVAVQRRFITDGKLKDALHKSLYIDPQYGECYEMALKSISTSHRILYHHEKGAFEWLLKDQNIPIVRYLGCYSHGDPTNGVTHNLLLEYGQMDLDEFFADLTNVPPVRAMEIIRFWGSLFKVADAIHKVHHLDIPQGKRSLNYDGWHADIKPDNILSVHGEFKLADFGFARFAERELNGLVPMHSIEGGTDTYCAPEIARMRKNGTSTPVMQTIDTWSFGCVLSVAATWVVLGLQGIRQYGVLRRLARSNQTASGKPTDKFHDGERVLLEIQDWHNFLRSHIRSSDTATPLVLDLVESHMLRSKPGNRLSSKKLCESLRNLITSAKAIEIEQVGDSKPTSDSVKRALFVIDESAEVTDIKTTTPDTAVFQSQIQVNVTEEGGPASTLHMAVDASDSVWKRAGKEARLKSVPLAKTPHRKEILREEMEKSTVFLTVKKPVAQPATFPKKHQGELADSPVDDPTASQTWNGRRSPRYPKRNEPSPRRPSNYTSPSRSQNDVPTIAAPIARRLDRGPFLNDKPPPRVSSTHEVLLVPSQNSSPESSRSSSLPHVTVTKSTPPSRKQEWSPRGSLDTPINFAGDAAIPQELSATNTYSVQGLSYSLERSVACSELTQEESRMLEQLEAKRERARTSTSSAVPIASSNISKPVLASLGHQEAKIPARHVSESLDEVSRTSDKIMAVTYNSASQNNNANFEATMGSEKEPMRIVSREPPEAVSIPTPPTLSVPSHVYDLEWDVCKVRKALEQQQPRKNWAKFKQNFKPSKESKDSYLNKYIYNRDIIFVLDNGTTMSPHWPQVSFVAQTLAMKVAGLDEDGIDVIFTIGRHCNRNNLRGPDGLESLKTSLQQARPLPPDRDIPRDSTDMNGILQGIFSRYWTSNQCKATTVIVLTDGVFEGTDPPHSLNETIVNFAREVEADSRRFLARHFTIGFVRFGDGAADKAYLELLDDQLCKQNMLR
ncbi:hypothetical protein BDV95DRAFT_290159 [Massariosphaeria phaeospora]|uniref:Protein kinase domain-containing protein n=1 Tax=Massariosphaeria phaeospora TaxID=100035 RepID=A0A7C8HYA8_9PLEO|nr:hypothetical protein BDV95DRAFT_290159 [Massariosphaeria phaeospora]